MSKHILSIKIENTREDLTSNFDIEDDKTYEGHYLIFYIFYTIN